VNVGPAQVRVGPAQVDVQVGACLIISSPSDKRFRIPMAPTIARPGSPENTIPL